MMTLSDSVTVADPAQPMFGNAIADWHGWFAWKPVKTWDGRWRWLTIVERRRCQLKSYIFCPYPTLDQWWQHRVRP
jgi:hypothetical protein